MTVFRKSIPYVLFKLINIARLLILHKIYLINRLFWRDSIKYRNVSCSCMLFRKLATNCWILSSWSPCHNIKMVFVIHHIIFNYVKIVFSLLLSMVWIIIKHSICLMVILITALPKVTVSIFPLNCDFELNIKSH